MKQQRVKAVTQHRVRRTLFDALDELSRVRGMNLTYHNHFGLYGCTPFSTIYSD